MKIKTIFGPTLQLKVVGKQKDEEMVDLFEILQRRLDTKEERFSVLIIHYGEPALERRQKLALTDFLSKNKKLVEEKVRAIAIVSADDFDLSGAPSQVFYPECAFGNFGTKYDALKWLESVREGDL